MLVEIDVFPSDVPHRDRLCPSPSTLLLIEVDVPLVEVDSVPHRGRPCPCRDRCACLSRSNLSPSRLMTFQSRSMCTLIEINCVPTEVDCVPFEFDRCTVMWNWRFLWNLVLHAREQGSDSKLRTCAIEFLSKLDRLHARIPSNSILVAFRSI